MEFLERALIRAGVRFPFGDSLLIVAAKPGSAYAGVYFSIKLKRRALPAPATLRITWPASGTITY